MGAIGGGEIEATEKVKAVYSAPFDLELRVYFQLILNSSEALAGAVSDVCVCVCVCLCVCVCVCVASTRRCCCIRQLTSAHALKESESMR
jgi:hypothetical protein